MEMPFRFARSRPALGPSPTLRCGARALAALCLLAGLSGCGESAAEGNKPPARATSVAVAPVERDDVVVDATYPGELASDAAVLAARISAQVAHVGVRIGDRVGKGQLLARLDDAVIEQELAEARAQLGVAQATVLRARSDADLAVREQERIAPLADKALVTAQEADAAAARAAAARAELAVAEAGVAQARARVGRLEEQLRDARLVAPFDGVVSERHVDAGTVVSAGTPILRVVASEPLRVRFRVPERDITRIRVGMGLEVLAGGVSASGQVERLSGEISRSDRTLAVEGTVQDPSGLLRPGMFARVRVKLEVLEGALVVPGAALLERPAEVGAVPGERGALTTGVFVADEGEVARWIPLEVLGRAGDRVAVAGELPADARVLVMGHEALTDGAPIRTASGAGGGDGR